jgi:hypothetical protein
VELPGILEKAPRSKMRGIERAITDGRTDLRRRWQMDLFGKQMTNKSQRKAV